MIILSVDPGRTYGIVVFNNNEALEKDEGHFEDMLQFYNHIKFFISKYNPEVIIYGTPVYRIRVVAFQSKMLGVLDLLALKNNISAVPCVDNTCRKEVFGSGKGAVGKEYIMDYYKQTSEHLADCFLFKDYFLKYQEGE